MRKTIVSTALTAALLGAMAFSTSAAATDLAPQVMTLSANVTNACTFSLNDFAIDTDGITVEQDSSTYIYVECNQDTNYAVSIDPGENFGLATRRPTLRAMTDGAGHYLPYDMFTDTTYSVPFSTANVAGVGNGDFQTLEIGVAVYDMSYVPQGSYSDHVNVTLTFN